MRVARNLPAHPATAAAVRRLVRTACRGTGLESVRSEAVLVASELVSVAITYAGHDGERAPLALQIHAGKEELRMAVAVPPECDGLVDAHSEALVGSLATAWGLDPDRIDIGRALWFRLVAPDAVAARTPAPATGSSAT